MGVVIVLHDDASRRALIRRGLPRCGIRVQGCRTFHQVEAVLAEQLVDAVVVDVRAGWAEATFELASRFPRIPVFAWSAFRPDDGVLLRACGRAGLRGCFVQGVDDSAVGELVAARTAGRRRRRALADGPRLLRLTERIQRRTWDEILARAERPMTTADLARALSRTREHLSREFAAGGAPNLKRVIDVVRAAWAADLLGNPGYTVAAVARLLGYSSSSHLAGSVRRVAGVTPAELPALGPRGVLQRFLDGRMRSRLG